MKYRLTPCSFAGHSWYDRQYRTWYGLWRDIKDERGYTLSLTYQSALDIIEWHKKGGRYSKWSYV